jgi:ABC-type transporter MlaC component
MVDAVRRRDRADATLILFVLASSLILGSVFVPAAQAGAPTETMRDFFAAVNAVLSDPRSEDQPLEKLRAIRRHVDEVFDFREAAILALGPEWSARTPLEQNEFVPLFADLLERSFVWRVAGKAALGGGVKVHYAGETMDGDIATVDTTVAARDGNPLKLEYRMVRRASRWVVRDVVMDGVSTMENYHAQFQRVVRDSSWRGLVAQLRAKVGAPAIQIAAAPPPPRPAQRSTVMLVASPAPPERSLPGAEDRRAIARDVAAAVTPALAVSDAPLPRQPAPAAPQRRVGPPPSPTGPIPGTAARAPDGVGLPATSVAVPAAAAEQPRTPSAFWIQVGAYRNPTTAGQVARRVSGEIMVMPSPGASEPLLRVRIGPFGNRAQAAARLPGLRRLGYQPFVAAE